MVVCWVRYRQGRACVYACVHAGVGVGVAVQGVESVGVGVGRRGTVWVRVVLLHVLGQRGGWV